MSPTSSAGGEERVDGVEQVGDLGRRTAGRGPRSRRGRCRWSRSASARATAARRSSGRRPRGRSRPRSPAARALSTTRCVPREGRMTGTSASSCSSAGRSRSAQTPVALTTLVARTSSSSPLSASRSTRADRAAALLQQADGLEPVGEDGAEALGLGQHGQDQPGVVGLAVVEEVAAGRRAVGQRGQQLEDLRPGDHAVAGRAPVGLVAHRAGGGGAAGRPPSRRRRSGRARRRGRAARRRTREPRTAAGGRGAAPG